MPSFVNPEKCDGCKALERTACEYICPNDLMTLDKETMKAYNREPDMCWECYSCVKMCPQGAVDVRGYVDYSPLGGACVPMRGTDSIMWTVKYRNGKVLRFKFAIRTTPWGSIQPFEGFPEPTEDALKSELLAGEPDIIGLSEFPQVKKKA
ncbi:MAG: adenylyl-sulfate reductase subunit beta [Archaeoglobus sp.]|uniref:adenylyl-sulfate reductase subunit beta n=1 Tax=Archaeoglobus sp. TaxID=1872626 RepID=UPI001D789BB4|nr:adenylyl-sulfate reductase subunit beta [Archaeoglobus sp.]MBO8180085.1 adenylyl-sulfate reductase subunit beta [Archaeoglobus sp.]